MKKIKFCRVGGLSPVIQDGYTSDTSKRGFHTPPARKGIYAFIYPYFDMFLLGGSQSRVSQKHGKFEYLKDFEGNRIKLYAEDFNYDVNNSSKLNPKLKKYLKKGKHTNLNRNYDGTDITNKFWTEEIRDENNNYINYYLVKRKKLKIFEHTGEVWHHLKNSAVKPFEILNEIGDWIQTDYDVFVRALERDKIDNLKYLMQKKYFKIEEINSKNIYTFVSNDHLEVFIERIKN